MMERYATGIRRRKGIPIFVLLLTISARGTVAQTSLSNSDGTAPTAPTVPSEPYTPLTSEQRFHGYVKNMFGPLAIVTGAASAGWGVLRDRPREWPLGAYGFGLRMGSGMAQRITKETLTYGASSLLHEDNRYFASGKTGTGARIVYAVESTFLTRKEDGSRTFAYSRIGGMAGSSLISRTWQPASTGSLKSAGVNFYTSLAVGIGFNVAREFLPKKFKFLK